MKPRMTFESNVGFNDKDDSRDGIDKYLKRNPETSFVQQLMGNRH